jgi:hypothetical protein
MIAFSLILFTSLGEWVGSAQYSRAVRVG